MGSYGSVYRCKFVKKQEEQDIFEKNAQNFALKIMPFEFEYEFENMVSIIRELWATSSENCGIQRLGIVKFPLGSLNKHGIKISEKFSVREEEQIMGIGIALPLGDFTLQDMIVRSNALGQRIPRSVVSIIVTQLIKKLYDLHVKLQCIHRDLKPANIILSIRNNSLIVNIIDYGMLTFRSNSRDPGVTTSTFRAPEVFLKSSYQNTVDIWSLGVIVFEMLTGEEFAKWKSKDSIGDATVLQNIWDRLGKPSIGEIDSFDTVEGFRILGNMSIRPSKKLSDVLLSSNSFNSSNSFKSSNSSISSNSTISSTSLNVNSFNSTNSSNFNNFNSKYQHTNQLDELDKLVLSTLQLDPERRPDILTLSKINFNYSSREYVNEASNYIYKLSQLVPPTRTISQELNIVFDTKSIHIYSFEIKDETSKSKRIKIFDDYKISELYIQDEKNARYAILEGLLKLKTLHSFPDSFLWNSLMIADILLSQTLKEFNTDNTAFTQKEADIFLCSIAFICAAPFEERPFILEQDFLKPFIKHEHKKCFESIDSKIRNLSVSVSVPEKIEKNEKIEKKMYSKELQEVQSYIPPSKAVMKTILNILELLNYTLITFGEYCGKTSLEINSYSLDVCEEMFERFCNSQGKKSWLNTFDI